MHHHCLLVGYGADAVNPYLSFEALSQARRDGILAAEWTDAKIVAGYRHGVAKGLLKVMAKMGISHPPELQGGADLRGRRAERRGRSRPRSSARRAASRASASPSSPRKGCGGTSWATRPARKATACRCCRTAGVYALAEGRREARLEPAHHRHASRRRPAAATRPPTSPLRGTRQRPARPATATFVACSPSGSTNGRPVPVDEVEPTSRRSSSASAPAR